ncbi:Uncharacterised protein [Vibrio cholerae]|nr:Uncharacterised protein [Vibrio cholerae]
MGYTQLQMKYLGWLYWPCDHLLYTKSELDISVPRFRDRLPVPPPQFLCKAQALWHKCKCWVGGWILPL